MVQNIGQGRVNKQYKLIAIRDCKMTPSKKHEVREQLTLISTGVYLMMQAQNDDERIERYDMVQASIDDRNPPQHQYPDVMLR